MSAPLRAIVWPGMPDEEGLRLAAERIGRQLDLAVIASNEDLERLLDSEGPWDLITPSDYMVEKLAAAGRLAELDPEGRLDRGWLADWARQPSYDPEGRFSWPLAFGTTGYLYDREQVGEPATWAEFFAPAENVMVGLLAEVREVVGAALIAAGDSPNETSSEALSRAAALLRGQRLAVASISSDDFTGPIESGQVAMHHAWSGPAAMAARRHARLGYTLPREGAIIWVTTAAIPADAPDPEAARRLLAELVEPEIARLAVERGGYSTPNERVRAALDEEIGSDPVLFPSPEEIARCHEVRHLAPTAEARLFATWSPEAIKG